jgi:hypothetical protein
MGLERGPLSLVSTIKEILGRKSSGSGLKIREYGRRDPSRWPRGTLYPQKLAPSSPTSGGRSVGIDRSRTEATEFMCLEYRERHCHMQQPGGNTGQLLPPPPELLMTFSWKLYVSRLRENLCIILALISCATLHLGAGRQQTPRIGHHQSQTRTGHRLRLRAQSR